MPRVAIVQAGSVVYNTQATLDKVEEFAQNAAADGAELILFPEAFVGSYPKAETFGLSLGKRSEEGRDEFKRYFDGAINYDGAESDRLATIAKQNSVHLVIGVVEKDGSTLYCSVFFFGPDGSKLGKHRKLMPTAMERCLWGEGDGSTLRVVSTSVGKIASAICWESYMPLLRMHYYNQGVQIYLAPTVDDRDVWLSLMRTIALEGRCFVVSACQFLTTADYPKDHTMFNENNEILIRGGSCAVGPLGNVLVEPLFNANRIAFVDIDLGEITRGKFDLDVSGHYARPDVFELFVNEKQQLSVQSKNH